MFQHLEVVFNRPGAHELVFRSVGTIDRAFGPEGAGKNLLHGRDHLQDQFALGLQTVEGILTYFREISGSWESLRISISPVSWTEKGGMRSLEKGQRAGTAPDNS